VALSVLAFTAWYWARVVLMFHRAMPDLAGNKEGAYRAAWRPHIVMWWPRLVGFMVFFGCAWGLKQASDLYEKLEAEAFPLRSGGRGGPSSWDSYFSPSSRRDDTGWPVAAGLSMNRGR
jgi:hypothetical protein